MSVSYLKVICARSWGHIEALGDLRSAKNKLTATLFLIHNQMNHPVHLYLKTIKRIIPGWGIGPAVVKSMVHDTLDLTDENSDGYINFVRR